MNIWYWGWQEATKFMIIIRFIDSSLDIFDWAFNQQTIWNDNINLTANKVNLLLKNIELSIIKFHSLLRFWEAWYMRSVISILYFVIDCKKSYSNLLRILNEVLLPLVAVLSPTQVNEMILHETVYLDFQYKNGILPWLVNSYTNLVDFTEGVDVQGTSLELHILRVLEKKSWNIKFGNWDNQWVENKFAKNTINSGWSWDHGAGMGVFAAGKFKRKPYQNN